MLKCLIAEYHAGTVGLACLYIVCEQEMNPRFYDEMCRYKSDVEITPEYLKLIVNDLKAQVPTASVRVRPAAEHFLPRMCGELGLTHKVQAKAAKFLPGLQRQETSADSRMLLAVSIMMATVETPLESRTPAEVAETVGVDLVYLSKVYEKLVAQKSKMEKAKGCNGGDADSKDDID